MSEKIPAIICDLDGTLCNIDHRIVHVTPPHKDWSVFFAGISEDTVNQPVADILQSVPWHVIFVSGRPEDYRNSTLAWLRQHPSAHNYSLYMRRTGDYRPDALVKSEILDELLKKYDIRFAIDDRISVIEMWRSRGLWVFQVKSEETQIPKGKTLLEIMVGPSGAGKSYWLAANRPSRHIISSDEIREDLTGNFQDQSQNQRVFEAMHRLARTRLSLGLPTVLDATHIRRKDRLAAVGLANGESARYIVINRSLEDKRRDGGWRNAIEGKDLIGDHENTFRQNYKDILRGDGQPNVEVIEHIKEGR